MTTSNVIGLPGRTPEWTFGDRVRRIRRTAGLNQIEFAQRLGITHQRLSQWESDRNKPGDIVAVAKRIRQEFGVPVNWTLGIEDEGPGGGGNWLPRLDSNQQPLGKRPGDDSRARRHLRLVA
jgi:transcriptional regulator with XRE-family HTH domain